MEGLVPDMPFADQGMPILLAAEGDRRIVQVDHAESVGADQIGEALPDAIVIADEVVPRREDMRGVESDAKT